MINQYIYAVGVPYEMITFKGDVGSYVKGIIMSDDAESTFKYCIFQDGYGTYGDQPYLVNPQTVHHSIFRYNNFKRAIDPGTNNSIKYNVFDENSFHGYGEHNFIMVWSPPQAFKYNIISNNSDTNNTGSAVKFYSWSHQDLSGFSDNVFINNSPFSVGTSSWNGWPMGIYSLPEQYWGHTDSEYVKDQILDFYTFNDRAVLNADTILEQPPAEAHGVVWKVLINGENPMDGNLEPLGGGPAEFEVHFNRPMDIGHDPFVTFGVRAPFTQNLIADNATWNADSTMWSATFNMELNTGDGINTVRVAHARDTDGFEIPIERGRFNFSVQVAGSQAVDFFATPGIGTVSLTWPEAESDEVLGYNLYRFEMLDTLATDTLLLNNVLITDNFFTDYDVIPDSTYYYMFTLLGTDFVESDFSKVVFATPYNAATGDANGDYNVDVLDIVAIVSYMLGHDPEPFLFEAADVNQDGVINVLDIVGVVQLINSDKEAISQVITTHPDAAYIALNKDRITLESSGQISALQFELLTSYPELISLSSLLPGFELGWNIIDNGVRVVLFSMQGNTIPEGLTEIISIDHSNPDLNWQNIIASDPEGQYVEILTGTVGVDEHTALPGDFTLELFPNPATTEVTISYFLPVLSDVRIEFYDLFGRKLHTISHTRQTAGEHFLTKNTARLGVRQGLILVRMTATGADRQNFEKTERLMVTP